MGRNSSVGTATRYGQDGPGTESSGDEIFRNCPDRPWDPPGFLYNEKNNPITGLDRFIGLQAVEALIFLDNRHMLVVRLSANTHRPPLNPMEYSWYSFLLETESTPGP